MSLFLEVMCLSWAFPGERTVSVVNHSFNRLPLELYLTRMTLFAILETKPQFKERLHQDRIRNHQTQPRPNKHFVQPESQIAPDNHDEVVLQETEEADLQWCLSCDVWEQQMITVYTDDMETLCSNCQHVVCSFSLTRALGFSVISEIIQSLWWKSQEQCCESVQKSGYLNCASAKTMNFRPHRPMDSHISITHLQGQFIHTIQGSRSENEIALIYATDHCCFTANISTFRPWRVDFAVGQVNFPVNWTGWNIGQVSIFIIRS